jgi:hypothetical protein
VVEVFDVDGGLAVVDDGAQHGGLGVAFGFGLGAAFGDAFA